MRKGMDSATKQKAWRSGLRRGICGLGNGRMNFVSDDSDAKCDGREDDDEDEQAPPGAETILADENLAQSRGPCGREWFGRWQHCIPIQGASACVAKSLS